MTAETTCRFEELDGGVLAVGLRPELNEVPWTDIERIGSGVVGRVASRDRPRVLVDLSELNHMGSAMVALVVRIWKAATERNGRMVVVNRNDLVGEVLQISGLAGKWTIVPSRDDALSSFGASPRGAAAHGSRAGVALAVASGVALVVGLLAIADALLDGVAAEAIGRQATLWAGVALSVVAAALGAVAVTRTDGTLKMVVVSVTTLAAVVALAGAAALAGVFDRPEPNPTPDARRAA